MPVYGYCLFDLRLYLISIQFFRLTVGVLVKTDNQV